MPLAEHDVDVPEQVKSLMVSIHVPLAEHDIPTFVLVDSFSSFNSRAPRGARPDTHRICSTAGHCFNSRAPRGARPQGFSVRHRAERFNSRAPRGARPNKVQKARQARSFNSRAPRGARLPAL